MATGTLPAPRSPAESRKQTGRPPSPDRDPGKRRRIAVMVDARIYEQIKKAADNGGISIGAEAGLQLNRAQVVEKLIGRHVLELAGPSLGTIIAAATARDFADGKTYDGMIVAVLAQLIAHRRMEYATRRANRALTYAITRVLEETIARPTGDAE